MSKQHVLDIIQTAQGRAAAIHSTAPGFAFNEHLSVECQCHSEIRRLLPIRNAQAMGICSPSS